MRCPTLKDLPPPPPGKTGWPWTEESPQLPDTMPDGRPWPKISIVTPSYNQGEFIEETIRSVLLQGYPNLEYIIIDGGSTDGSVDIMKKYEPWLAYWISEPDRGQTHAINKGFSCSTGEILAWLNSDDVYLPNTFGKVAVAFAENLDTILIYGDILAADVTLKNRKLWRGTYAGSDVLLRPYHGIRTELWQPAVFFRRSAWLKAGPLDESLHYVMDYDYWIRLSFVGEFSRLDHVCALHRLHETSKTVTSRQQFSLETARVWRKHLYRLNGWRKIDALLHIWEVEQRLNLENLSILQTQRRFSYVWSYLISLLRSPLFLIRRYWWQGLREAIHRG